MNPTAVEMFELERRGSTVIITPTMDLGSLDFEQINENGEQVLRAVADPTVKSVVIDFGRINYFSSSAIAFFGRIWSVLHERRGKMALCNLNSDESNLIRITKLNTLWAIRPSLDEALSAAAD